MLRASRLSSIPCPAFRALRLSLIPTLNLSTAFRTSWVLYICSMPLALSQNHQPRFSQCFFLQLQAVPINDESSTVHMEQVLIVSKPRILSLLPTSCSRRSSSGGAGREIQVQHLLVKGDNVKLLLDLQQRISEGENLSDLAVEYSICPSKEEGGMLGWVRKGQMLEFEEAAFNSPLNKVVRCKTKFGWHLLQVISEREESLVEDIQANEFHVKMQDQSFLKEAQLIDVREPEEVARASLPGFKVLPLKQLDSWGPEITTKFDPQKDTYVMCHHGVRSLKVAKWLQKQGFKRVYNISGGIDAYAKVDPSVPTYTK
ncbi:Peptidyl-prolyl cis-trans isomerase [Quillaja saponaria]|uniref:Peptidyl-prolyl cis-trans isomerase n=1 Tax=Quillaja saponaria TaxID=32244 RepID=A0AAD7LMA0_QUISA|nr:Peptidyl-prolyl cis-trans isomerase [Quillaja saponaria]